MLRQESGEGLSLADFVAPAGSGNGSPFGVFAVSVHSRDRHCNCAHCEADYEPMLLRSVKITLAEAVSLWLDSRLKDELKASDISARIIKPAAGYACCPDHSLKKDILGLIPGSEKLEISLTESFAMIPDASICGFIFAHPEASYPDILRLSSESIEAYAQRRQLPSGLARNLLSHLG